MALTGGNAEHSVAENFPLIQVEERAIRNVCRLYGVKAIDALPRAIRAAALALLGPQV
jgi:hypothetical protein